MWVVRPKSVIGVVLDTFESVRVASNGGRIKKFIVFYDLCRVCGSGLCGNAAYNI